MLKRSYNNLTDIPTEYRDQYVPKGGKYVLDVEGFENVDSVLDKNAELLAQHATDQTRLTALTGEVATLTTERDAAKSTSLPAGHVAVPATEAQLFSQYKALGTPQELSTIKEEHPRFKSQIDERTQGDLYEMAAKAAGLNPAAFRQLARTANLNIEMREVDESGDKVQKPIVKFKENDKDVEKPLVEYIESSPDFKPFEASLKAGEGSGTTDWPRQSAGDAVSKTDLAGSLINNRYGQHAAQPGNGTAAK